MVALDLAAILVEANARGLLGVKGHGLEAETLFEDVGVIDGLVPNLLIVRDIELDANATVLCIDEKSKVVSGGSAPQRASVILRGFLRIERLHKLRHAQGDLPHRQTARRLHVEVVGESYPTVQRRMQTACGLAVGRWPSVNSDGTESEEAELTKTIHPRMLPA